MQSVYAAAGGDDGLLRLAEAWHARVMADEIVSHAFSHGFHPQHSERLAAYWAEALGGPRAYSERYGDETAVVRIHSGNGPHEEMDRRAIACFDRALEDVGLTDEPLRRVLHDYFAWATTTTMSAYHHSAEDVPAGLTVPRWSWQGLDTSESDVADRIERLDVDLFSFVPFQAQESDARALLALHTAVAAATTPFAYLEIGSYRGGSLQALVRDPRCSRLMSIDPRTTDTPDDGRGSYTYEDNTTAKMLDGLSHVPGADLGKLATFEATTESMSPGDLPQRPDFCFVDGEHSHRAVLSDARFCAEALDGAGVIAFHDWGIVQSAIKAFLRERWRDVSFALAINRSADPRRGFGVFALELGAAGILEHPAIASATGARSHQFWRIANRPRRSALPLLLAWEAMPAIDATLAQGRRLTHARR